MSKFVSTSLCIILLAVTGPAHAEGQVLSNDLSKCRSGPSTLVQISGLSRAHFSRCFAESEGIPPAEFVLQQRLQRAAKLLTRADFLPVKEVAILCGFEDANYFSKVFRRLYGIDPTQFRTTGMYASLGNHR